MTGSREGESWKTQQETWLHCFTVAKLLSNERFEVFVAVKIEVVRSSEMLVSYHSTTWHCKPEGLDFNSFQ
jgi:hypothetical protein